MISRVNDGTIGETITGLSSILSEAAASLLEPLLKQHDLGFGSFDLLSAVYATDGKATQSEIARRMGISPPTLTEAIKTAAKKGLLEQRCVHNDMRARSVHLTKKGEEVLEKCLQLLDDAECEILKGLQPADVETAKDVLKHSIQVLLKLQNSSRN